MSEETMSEKLEALEWDIGNSVSRIRELLEAEVDKWRTRAIDAEDRESELEDEVKELKGAKSA